MKDGTRYPFFDRRVIVKYAWAHESDLPDIESLLSSHELPAGDCLPHLDNFVVVRENGDLVAVGGFEVCGDYALLRSFAVTPYFRGKGIARRVFGMLAEKATTGGLAGFYLLTTTAREYFSLLGFEVCERESSPAAIRRTLPHLQRLQRDAR